MCAADFLKGKALLMDQRFKIVVLNAPCNFAQDVTMTGKSPGLIMQDGDDHEDHVQGKCLLMKEA